MPGKVIVITSGKGGVGKTTTCANIGAGLANRAKNCIDNMRISVYAIWM